MIPTIPHVLSETVILLVAKMTGFLYIPKHWSKQNDELLRKLVKEKKIKRLRARYYNGQYIYIPYNRKAWDHVRGYYDANS